MSISRSKDQPLVSIGIPIFNEEKNILQILESLIAQESNRFILLEIIIVSDGSIDNSVELIRSIRDDRIKVIEHAERRGQAARQNEILVNFSGDILILVEGDTIPSHTHALDELVSPVLVPSIKEKKLGLIFGDVEYVLPKGRYSKLTYFGGQFRRGLYRHWKNGKNFYMCSGHSPRAITREAASKFFWPEDAPEDAYLYCWMKQNGFRIDFAPNARFIARHAAGIVDRVRQVNKYSYGKKMLSKFFSMQLLKTERVIPLVLCLRYVFGVLTKHPVLVILYLSEWCVTRFCAVFIPYSPSKYTPYVSSKDLQDVST